MGVVNEEIMVVIGRSLAYFDNNQLKCFMCKRFHLNFIKKEN